MCRLASQDDHGRLGRQLGLAGNLMQGVIPPCRDKCDPTSIWKLADRYLSSFNDISMLMYRQEFQKRLVPFTS